MKWANRFFIFLIAIYKNAISPFLPPACRFTPTCSEYAREAFEKYAWHKAFWLAGKRLLRCHPFCNKHGFDPLP